MWTNTVQLDGTQMTIRRMRTACWITEATNTHSESVILIAYPRKQWFLERASMACAVSVTAGGTRSYHSDLQVITDQNEVRLYRNPLKHNDYRKCFNTKS